MKYTNKINEIKTKIDEIKTKIDKINSRIEANNSAIDQLKPEVTDFETQLKTSRKIMLLEPNDANKKTIVDIEKQLVRSKTSLDDLVLLDEALIEKKEELFCDLSEADRLLKVEELNRILSHEQKIFDDYERSIFAAHEAIVKAKILANEVKSRGGISRFSSLVYSKNFDFYSLKTNSGSYIRLSNDLINHASIVD